MTKSCVAVWRNGCGRANEQRERGGGQRRSAVEIFDEKPKGGSRGSKQPSINRGPENGGLGGSVEKGWDRRVRFCSHS